MQNTKKNVINLWFLAKLFRFFALNEFFYMNDLDWQATENVN